jgi:hypothetical protein
MLVQLSGAERATWCMPMVVPEPGLLPMSKSLP